MDEARLDFIELLTRAGREISGSLDFRDTLNRVATMFTTSGFADWCGVYLTSPAGRFERAWVRHRDPAMDAFVQDYLGRPPRSNVLAELSPALVEARAVLFPRVDERVLASWAQDDVHLAALRALGIGSLIAAPLIAGKRVVGALTLVRIAPVRLPYASQDLSVAEEIGRQGGWAIENARLHAREAENARWLRGILGVVAHDLNNPISTAQGAVTLVQEGTMSPEQGGAMAMRALERMQRLVADLLDAARVDAAEGIRIVQSAIPLQHVIEAVTESQAARVAEKQLEWVLEMPRECPPVWADHARLVQLLVNLCGNATKFTPPGGRITVKVEEMGDRMRIAVRDTGPGIALEDQARVFDGFWQGADTAHQGTGLGLTIAKGIAEAHGGGIVLDSRPGMGSEFTVTIPLAPDANSDEEKAVA